MPKRIENPTPKQIRTRKAGDKFVKNNPEAVKRHRRKTMLKVKYAITPAQFDEMLRSQGFACAICGNGKPGGHGWHVDHCHETKKIRGILCHYCNPALGLFRENIVIHRSAIMYLKKSRI
jgi:hypothetical protein